MSALSAVVQSSTEMPCDDLGAGYLQDCAVAVLTFCSLYLTVFCSDFQFLSLGDQFSPGAMLFCTASGTPCRMLLLVHVDAAIRSQSSEAANGKNIAVIACQRDTVISQGPLAPPLMVPYGGALLYE